MPVKKNGTPCRLDWNALYKSMGAEVTDFNCGTLCAPKNDGIPACCANDDCSPVLFREEIAWLKGRTKMWRRRRPASEKEKKEHAEIEDYIKHAQCRGVSHCDRAYRSMTCRFFPFEPYIDESGMVKGLTYVYAAEHLCPLIGHGKAKINSDYLRQALRAWYAIFSVYPRDYECYVEESRKLRRQFRRKERRIKVFMESGRIRYISP